MMKITDLLDEAGLYFGRERELLETVASLARVLPDGAMAWRGTNGQLAETLGCTTRTIERAWVALRALTLPWLEVQTLRGAGMVARIVPTKCRQSADKVPTDPRQTPDKVPTNPRQSADKMEPPRVCVPYGKNHPTDDLIASKATREAPSGDALPASQPALDLADWMMGELERRAGALVQRPKPLPSAAALESAAASLTATFGGDEAARRYCAARLVSYEERPTAQRPGTMARLIAWLLADSARAAVEGSSEAAPARPTSQSYVSEGFDADLAAAVAHGTRNVEADEAADAAWEAHLYREQCEAAFKEAKCWGDVPAGTPYSDDAMTRYGLWPARTAKKEALR